MFRPGRRALLLAACAILLGASARLHAWAPTGYSWPVGSDIVMHLQLDRPLSNIHDSSSSWNASAAAALAIWNQHLDTVRFVEAGPTNVSGGNGQNDVFFSDTIYGQSFGTNVLAFAIDYSTSGDRSLTEMDVIFNNAKKWGSYRGPVRGTRSSYFWDLRRVALHEFGHVLGLGHPDENGQPSAYAIMNSILGDLDTLTEDDIAGARSLYGVRITSPTNPITVPIGSAFTYQLTASRTASSFGASGLPAGLQINVATGLITGTPTISGTFSVTLSAVVAGKAASAVLSITVTPGGTAPSKTDFVREYGFGVNRLLKDPIRHRIYATVPLNESVAVIDTDTHSVIAFMPFAGLQPFAMTMSPDGTRLWVTNSGSVDAIRIFNLDTLYFMDALDPPRAPSDIEIGVGNRLYVTPANDALGIMQIDAKSGALQANLPYAELSQRAFLEISPDRRTLYCGSSSTPTPTVLRFDISSETPVFLQQRLLPGYQGTSTGATDFQLSHNGETLLFPTFFGNENPGGFPAKTLALSASDLSLTKSSFTGLWPYAGHAAFSNDDATVYLGLPLQDKIAAYNAASSILQRTISLGTSSNSEKQSSGVMVVDHSGDYLFVSATRSSNPAGSLLRIYRTGRTVTPDPKTAKSLLNVSTRLRSQDGDGVLIGGFIIGGIEPKKLALRAVGPSLPLGGRLADPILELRSATGEVIAANDNWNSRRTEVLASGLAPSDEREAVILTTLPAGAYTAILRGSAGTTGVALVEVYDLSPASNSRIANISTRGKVETGDNVMIGGFIIGGDQPTKVIVRAIGPSLTTQGVPGALADSTLALHDKNGAKFAENDDWQSDQSQEIIDSTVPPTDAREAAIVRTLAPGNYTAIVRGKNDTSGVALVEVYNLEPR